MSRQTLEYHSGVFSIARTAEQPGQILVAQLPSEDMEKGKREVIPSMGQRGMLRLTSQMLSSVSGGIEREQVPIDAMMREIGEEWHISPQNLELIPLADWSPLVVVQERSGRHVLFCCFGFECWLYPKGAAQALQSTELRQRKVRFAEPAHLLSGEEPLRPLLAATLHTLLQTAHA